MCKSEDKKREQIQRNKMSKINMWATEDGINEEIGGGKGEEKRKKTKRCEKGSNYLAGKM